MDKAFIGKMEQLLIEEHDKIKKEIETIAIKDPEGAKDSYEVVRPEYSDSDDDTSIETTDFQNNAALASQLEAELKEIDSALVRIERGKYGVCEVCGKEIPQDRLEALPSARLHLDCVSKK